MEHSSDRANEQKERIEENLKYIKTNISKMDKPIFIELLGTAKSGKTTLLNNITGIFESYGIPVQKRAETAEYNPIQNKDIEEYNIWMYSELMKNLSEDMSNKTPRVVIYDRGLLDRIPWIDFSVHEGSIPQKDGELLKQLLKSEFMKKYSPICYGFVTSPELSVYRKGKEGRLVNKKSVKLFNDCMSKEREAIQQGSKKYTEIETDPYQGFLKSFIRDVAEGITFDVREQIQEREKEQQEEQL